MENTALDALPVDLGQDGFDVASPVPHGTSCALCPELVQVLEMEADDAAFELLQLLDRIQLRPHPMPGVGARADALAAALAHLQHRVRVPVPRRLGMIVQRHVQLVLVAQLLDRVECVRRGFGNDGLDAHVLGELERLAAGVQVLRQSAHAVVDQLDAAIRQLGLDLAAEFRAQRLVDFGVRLLAAHFLAGVGFDVVQPQRRVLVDGFIEGVAIEAVRLATEPPAELLGVGRPLASCFAGSPGAPNPATPMPRAAHPGHLKKTPSIQFGIHRATPDAACGRNQTSPLHHRPHELASWGPPSRKLS